MSNPNHLTTREVKKATRERNRQERAQLMGLQALQGRRAQRVAYTAGIVDGLPTREEQSLHAHMEMFTSPQEVLKTTPIEQPTESNEQIDIEELFADTPVDAPETPEAQEDEEHQEVGERDSLNDILDSSGALAETWVPAGSVPEEHGAKQGSGFSLLRSRSFIGMSQQAREEAQKVLETKSRDNTLREFNNEQIAEVVTFTHLGDSALKEVLPVAATPGDNVVLFTYETTAGKFGKNPHLYRQGTAAVPIGGFRYQLVMPEKEAIKLKNEIENDPETVHALTDKLFTEYFEMQESSWKSLGPQYDKWKEINGGVTRIAVRQGVSQPIDQAEIFEKQ